MEKELSAEDIVMIHDGNRCMVSSEIISDSLAKFKKPTHQISFHTEKALQTIRFVEGVRVYEE